MGPKREVSAVLGLVDQCERAASLKCEITDLVSDETDEQGSGGWCFCLRPHDAEQFAPQESRLSLVV